MNSFIYSIELDINRTPFETDVERKRKVIYYFISYRRYTIF